MSEDRPSLADVDTQAAKAFEKFVEDSKEMDKAWSKGTLDEWLGSRLDDEWERYFGEPRAVASTENSEGDGVVASGA